LVFRPAEQTILLLSSVHRLFVESVRYEIRQRKILDPESPQGRLLMSELTFYGQSLKRLNVIPEDKLQREALERIWEDLWSTIAIWEELFEVNVNLYLFITFLGIRIVSEVFKKLKLWYGNDSTLKWIQSLWYFYRWFHFFDKYR